MFSFHERLLWRLLTGVLVVMMLTIAAPNARAASTDSTVHAVKLVSPAVVRIVTEVDGQVVYHAPDGSTITFPSKESTYGWVFSGSGALIRPDGYVLTADHVVDYPQNDPYIEGLFLQSLIQGYAKTQGISEDQASRVVKQVQSQLSFSYKVTRQQVFLSTAYTGPLHNIAQLTSYDVTRIVKSSPVEKQDVAIIKIEADDLPYLTLASASSIHVQDNVTAIAFPGDAETSSFVALTDPTHSTSSVLTQLLTPTVENGQVTSEKPLSDGTPAYETSNLAGTGSSGGPVIDSQGQIIGFIDAASSNLRVILLVPSEVVVSYTREAGIANLQTGAFMSLWRKAITEYDATGRCHWTQAYQDLKQLHENYSQFGGIESFLKEAQAQATPSECPPPPPPPRNWLADNWLLLAGLGAGVVLLGGIGFSLFVLPRRKKALSQATAATTSTSADAISAVVVMPDSMADGSKQTEGMASSIQASPTLPESAPAIRKCIAGHVVTVETAHFCPECGASIEEPKESKVLQGQT